MHINDAEALAGAADDRDAEALAAAEDVEGEDACDVCAADVR